MKRIEKAWIAVVAVAVIIHFAVLIHSGISAEKDRIRQSWLDGYRQRQIENLPEIGIDNKKRPAPGLLGKG